ncbi:sucrase-isomaltase, intestinal-like [Babylonia areolata]|uniref:sucrase-isomaltase, intestinal-like n=1 Tax=Babylonia areolata TaxID=304850 RepID=UPI003FD08639
MDTGVGGLVFHDQFLQLSSRLASRQVFGMGETVHRTFRRDLWYRTYPLFARDQSTRTDDTLVAIGRPYMPPYWALGFQLCKYGYNSLENLRTAVERTKAADIPHDVQYADIDHMSERRDFTVDNGTFRGLPEYFDELRQGGMRTIIILDPALVSNSSGYGPYERLRAVRGFVQWPPNTPGYTPPRDSATDQGDILGWVWPKGKVVFPDFFKPETRRVWKELIVEHRNRIAFDGLWIDMNEPTAFGTNEDRPFNWPEGVKPYWSLTCPVSNLDDPPYRTGAAFGFDTPSRRGRLSDKTLCLSAVQGQHHQYRHYDVHSLYGWSQTEPTLQSTFVGSGHYAGHWLGDNLSSWADLRASVVATPELCKRWMQLGAFYTFSRNHNAIGNRDQDPGFFDEEVKRVSREAMETRYWLLPHLYTLFHQVASQGGTVIRPLHHEFPTDPKALGNSRQFLWGSSLLISPVLEPNVTSLTYYIPEARWFDFYTGAEVTSKGGYARTVPVQSDSRTELLVRGGAILPMQAPARNTTYSRKNPLTLLVALDNNDDEEIKAQGQIFWDDGVSVVTLTQNNVAGTQSLHYDTLHVLGVGERVVSVSVTSEDGSLPGDLPFRWSYSSDLKVGTITEEEFSRVDCWPERQGGVDVPDASSCRKRNCVWQPHWHPKLPDCFFPAADFGYRVDGQFFESPLGQSARLTRLGPGPFGNDWTNVLFTVEEHGDDVLRFKFTTEDNSRYQVPLQLNLANHRATDAKYKFEVTGLDPFSFKDQFLQLSTRLCSPNVYGLGENVHPTFKRDLWYHTYPLFARDQGTSAEEAFKNHFNHYGTHPFYQCVEEDGNSHGVLLLNSSPQDYSFSPLPMLTYRTIGGILDFYMFLGPGPEHVSQQYTGAIGRPYMPPYWALGFQLCKYGYNSLENLRTAVERTKAADIPHRRDFTIDDVNFHGLPEYFQELREGGMRTIIILDPALVSNSSGYGPYERLRAVRGFVQWPPNTPGYTSPRDSATDQGDILGWVWPKGKTAFPDFFIPEARQVWKKLIMEHRQRIDFDGLWIDKLHPLLMDFVGHD